MTRDELDNLRDMTYGVTSWIDPSVKMPPEGTRVLVVVVKAHHYSVRIMRCSHKETTDMTSPLCFKSITDDEKVLGWLPLPTIPFNNRQEDEE